MLRKVCEFTGLAIDLVANYDPNARGPYNFTVYQNDPECRTLRFLDYDDHGNVIYKNYYLSLPYMVFVVQRDAANARILSNADFSCLFCYFCEAEINNGADLLIADLLFPTLPNVGCDNSVCGMAEGNALEMIGEFFCGKFNPHDEHYDGMTYLEEEFDSFEVWHQLTKTRPSFILSHEWKIPLCSLHPLLSAVLHYRYDKPKTITYKY